MNGQSLPGATAQMILAASGGQSPPHIAASRHQRWTVLMDLAAGRAPLTRSAKAVPGGTVFRT